jgi:hypothetical protein
VFLTVALSVAAASVASAQSTGAGGPDESKVRVRIGPLWMKPTIALTNLGVDTNVFNQAVGQAEKDYTATVTPQTDVWLRMGRTWISSNIKEDLVWYRQFQSERSANNSYKLDWSAPLNRLTFSAGGRWLNTRDRPGFEIAARLGRHEHGYSGIAEIRALSKTFIGVKGDLNVVRYDQDAVFLGVNLRDELNRTTTSASMTLRHQLTPLTTITFAAGRSQDRFEFSPLRDSHSTTFSGSVDLNPFALIKGSAALGYRNFAPQAPGLQGYKGATASVNLWYTLLSSTRFDLRATRDIEYSYNVNQPYYLLTGLGGSIAHQLFGPIDFVGRVGAEGLNYQDRTGAVVLLSNRVDHVHTYGGGFGYRLSSGARIGFDVDHYRRTSGIAGLQYEGLRYGTSVTYGF